MAYTGTLKRLRVRIITVQDIMYVYVLYAYIYINQSNIRKENTERNMIRLLTYKKNKIRSANRGRFVDGKGFGFIENSDGSG